MKRMVAWILALCAVFTILPQGVWAGKTSPFAGGDGTELSPYLVDSPEALQAVEQYPEAHFLQTVDIDLTGLGNWRPIQGFAGTYDGGGHAIHNLTIVEKGRGAAGESYGLFAEGRSAAFRNVILENMHLELDKSTVSYDGLSLKGDHCPLYVGGICADATGSVLENCSVSGKITVKDCAKAAVGGIAAYGAMHIIACSNDADISVVATSNYADGQFPVAYCGGITGRQSSVIYDQRVERCANYGNIQMTTNAEGAVGGICGKTQYNQVTDCVNFGAISADAQNPGYNLPSHAGGVVGHSAGSLKRCVNYGNVTGVYRGGRGGFYAGGVAGEIDELNGGGIRYCYNLGADIRARNTGDTGYAACGRVYGGFRFGGNGPEAGDNTANGCGSYEMTLLNGQPWKAPFQASVGQRNSQGVDLSEEALLRHDTYETFDFAQVWEISQQTGGPVLQGAETEMEKPVGFPELTYRANYLTFGQGNILSDVWLKAILIDGSYSPSRILIDVHGEDLKNAMQAWQALNDALDVAGGDVKDVAKENIRQHDLMVAYILEAVSCQVDIIMTDTFKSAAKEIKDLTSIYADVLKNYEGKKELFSDYCSENMEQVFAVLDEYYKAGDSQIAKFLKSADGIELVEAIAQDAVDYIDFVERVNSYVKLYHASGATKQVLRSMREQCPGDNRELKRALDTVCQVMDAASEELLLQMMNGEFAMLATVNGAAFAANSFGKAVSAKLQVACPIAAAALGICKAQSYAVNQLFGIDKTVEQYFKMCVITEVDAVAAQVVAQAIEAYRKDPTAENAEFLLTAIEVKFGFVDQDHAEAAKFAEVIQNEGMIRQILNLLGGKEGDVLSEKLQMMAKEKDARHEAFRTSWLKALEQEYPHIAARYTQEYRTLESTRVQYAVTVKCPVDVYVYDGQDRVVASVVKGKVTGSAAVTAGYLQGQKVLLFARDGDYRLECRGYDEGTMQVELRELDQEGKPVRVTRFYDLPVAEGSSHGLRLQTLREDTPVALLPDGGTVTADYDSSDQQRFAVTVENGYLTAELTGRTGQAAPGQRVQISALIPEGYTFKGWSVEEKTVEVDDPKSPNTWFEMVEGPVTVKAKLQRKASSSPADGEGVHWAVIVGGGILAAAGAVLLIRAGKKKKKA